MLNQIQLFILNNDVKWNIFLNSENYGFVVKN